jgi:hypothetical protein
MLVKDYTYYLWQFVEITLITAYGYLAIALFIVALVARLFFSGKLQGLLRQAPLLLILISAVIFITGLYSVEYEFDISLDRLEQAKNNPDDADCGSAWTDWWPTGTGLVNRCPKGCYRGITVRQKMKLTGFPPWPLTNRELQCWRRNPPWEVLAEKSE